MFFFASDYFYYTVRRGDTLNKIGKRYGVSWRRIAEANGIADPKSLQAGQVIKIPDGASAFSYTSR
ncbi:MAG: LysM domain-containing protein, partial [Candidatus Dadabacteria bacterium]